MAEKGPVLVENAGLKAVEVLYWEPLREVSRASMLARVPEFAWEFARYMVLAPSNGDMEGKWGGEDGSCWEELD